MPLQISAGAAGEADEPNVLVMPVRLEGVFADWLRERARAHGEPPEEHAARLLRAYWAHHDAWRHDQVAAPTRRRKDDQ